MNNKEFDIFDFLTKKPIVNKNGINTIQLQRHMCEAITELENLINIFKQEDYKSKLPKGIDYKLLMSKKSRK